MICKQGNVDLLLRVLNINNLELMDSNGLTPLLVLCGEYIGVECIEYAISLGANLKARDNVWPIFSIEIFLIDFNSFFL